MSSSFSISAMPVSSSPQLNSRRLREGVSACHCESHDAAAFPAGCAQLGARQHATCSGRLGRAAAVLPDYAIFVGIEPVEQRARRLLPPCERGRTEPNRFRVRSQKPAQSIPAPKRVPAFGFGRQAKDLDNERQTDTTDLTLAEAKLRPLLRLLRAGARQPTARPGAQPLR